MAADFHVDFLGCKISQTDAESIRDALVAAGHGESASNHEATVHVINTCCITAEAEAKSRKRVRKAVRSGGEDVHVFVTGCGATLHPESYADLGAQVTTLPGGAAGAAAAIVRAADQLPDLGCKGV